MQFDELLSKTDFGLRDIMRLVDKIVRSCNRWLPWMGPMAQWMSDAIDRLTEVTRKILSEIGKFFTRPGHPVALWNSGERWISEVGKRAGDQVGVVNVGTLRADDKWKGDAAESYFKGLARQSGALDKVHAIATDVGTSLRDIAFGIGAFWVGTTLAIAGVVVELVAAGAATAVPPTAPAGIAGAVASVAKFIAIWGPMVLCFYEYISSLTSQQSNLLAQLSDNKSFPGPPVGTWPKSTSEDFSDGSYSDNDKSDWQLKY